MSAVNNALRPHRPAGRAARPEPAALDRPRWSDATDEILAGDLTAALAYVTPARGVVLTPVAPIGLRDRDAGTVSFTTSLGFGRKLERIRANPRVALAFHARDHGFATGSQFVLVQGFATFDPRPDPAVLQEVVRPASARFMGEPKSGPFWDRWLSAYYADRVLVRIALTRVSSWPDLGCQGPREVIGAAAPEAVPSQSPPRGGVGPRVDPTRAAWRLRRLAHLLMGYVGTDGFPEVVPVSIGPATPAGLRVFGPLPDGGRRAGLMGHRYARQLIGLETRQYTGWLEHGMYAPHTANGFRAPANKTLLLLANGLMARRGRRRAIAEGRAG